jgi:hypothetical protein
MKKRIDRSICLKSLFVLAMLAIVATGFSFAPQREFYELKLYHFKDKDQEDRLDKFLQTAFLPAMHRLGYKKVGVFKPVTNDTAADKRIYVFIPYKSLDQILKVREQLDKDAQLQSSGSDYINAAYNNTPYLRMESIILRAFPGMPVFKAPAFTNPPSERIYELRSYEGPTEKYYKSKVKMFNQGGEIPLFSRLGFNAVFYSEVVAGSRMPNLMYMTTFENKASREEHWKSFSADEEWKKLSAMPEYKNNVSRNETIFLHPTDYSDI